MKEDTQGKFVHLGSVSWVIKRRRRSYTSVEEKLYTSVEEIAKEKGRKGSLFRYLICRSI